MGHFSRHSNPPVHVRVSVEPACSPLHGSSRRCQSFHLCLRQAAQIDRAAFCSLRTTCFRPVPLLRWTLWFCLITCRLPWDGLKPTPKQKSRYDWIRF